MSVYMLYPTKIFIAKRPPVNFFVRSFIRRAFVRRSFPAIFLLTQKCLRHRTNFRVDKKITANERQTNERTKKFTGGPFATNLFVGYKI